jgi:predicted transcriptional regulator
MSDPRPGQQSRAGTVAITAHLPKEVRDRLKILAVRLDRTMNDLMAEALTDLFAKHGEPSPLREGR